MISIHNLTVDFGSRLLFDQVSFVINRRDRIALVGKNGAGKSTLLKLIAGLEEPTSGHVSRPKGIRIGYLPQVMQLKDGNTVYEEVEQAFDDIRRIEEEVARLTDEMAGRTDYDSEGYAQLIEHYTNMSETLALMQQGNYHATIEQSLIGLGFERKDFRRPTSDFSGGWRMRIELAKLLLQRPEVLLLDEPTNHLDIESIGWLEQFIASNAGAVILVSHDRAFIDNTTIRTIEIELGHIYDYKTNYSH
ncbi:ABC-F family ATP-binding cassette domain-containing protein, partial [Porphyromonas loveana]